MADGYSRKELAAFLDGRNKPEDFIPVLERRLANAAYTDKHEDYAAKLEQLKRVGQALDILEGGE